MGKLVLPIEERAVIELLFLAPAQHALATALISFNVFGLKRARLPALQESKKMARLDTYPSLNVFVQEVSQI